MCATTWALYRSPSECHPQQKKNSYRYIYINRIICFSMLLCVGVLCCVFCSPQLSDILRSQFTILCAFFFSSICRVPSVLNQCLLTVEKMFKFVTTTKGQTNWTTISSTWNGTPAWLTIYRQLRWMKVALSVCTQHIVVVIVLYL